jgi:hypothetical protein
VTEEIGLRESVRNFAKDLEGAFGEKNYVVFLCGPTLKIVGKDADKDNAAALRLRLKIELESEGFEVVLGEDDGLEGLRTKYSGMAHENELQFIQGQSNAVLLIASSVGSFCELGLFSHQHVRENTRGTDFILILDEKFKNDISYLNEGPAKAIDNYGKLVHGDFFDFDINPVLERLKIWRNVWSTRRKGRPRGS